VFPYFATPNAELQTVQEFVELAADARTVWSVMGRFSLDWHPAVASVDLTGTGIGQLRSLRTLDGRQIIERLDTVDDAKRSYRYTLVSGVPASHYAGILSVTPNGQGSIAAWRVDFLADTQP